MENLKLGNLFLNLTKFPLFIKKLNSPKYVWLINLLEYEIQKKNFDSFLKIILNNFEALCDSGLFDYPVKDKLTIIQALIEGEKTEYYNKIFNKIGSIENRQLFINFCLTYIPVKSILDEILNFEEIKSEYFSVKKIGSNVTRSCKISGYKTIEEKFYVEFGDFKWYQLDNSLVDGLLNGEKVIVADMQDNLYEVFVDFEHPQENY